MPFQDWTPVTKGLCQIRFNSIQNSKYTRRHHHNLLKDTWPNTKNSRHNNMDYFHKLLEIHNFIKRILKQDANAYYNNILKGCCKFLGIEEDWGIDNQNNRSGFQLHNFGLVLMNNYPHACLERTIFIWKTFIILYGKFLNIFWMYVITNTFI